MRLSILLITFLGFSWSSAQEVTPSASTPLGKVEGVQKKSFGGKIFSSFEGIPYAKPPVGELRFEEAVAISPWRGTWKATKHYSCPQYSSFFGNVYLGEEDCLYVNVYVPHENVNPEERLEVVVHIHGGAYLSGSGYDYSRPEYLMDRNVIFVTFNYRLGILGFLSTEDNVLPGNLGLKDQVLALKWIQNNIESFGGNKDSITLTGMSAGSSSVHFHYLSPLSRGLFHRGLAQSGLATHDWSMQRGALEKSLKLGVALGCPTKSSKDLIDCLKERPVETIVDASLLFFGTPGWPIVPFSAVVEANSSTAFITDTPKNLVANKQVYDVPLIASTANDEGLLFALSYQIGLPIYELYWKDLAKYLLDYNYTLSPDKWEEAANKIKENYGEVNLSNFDRMISDRYFYAHYPTGVRNHAAAVSSPVYAYTFNYRGSRGMTQFITQDDQVLGTTHGDDALYIFTSDVLESNVPLKENDLKMRDFFLDMLELYAKTGSPLKFGGTTWKPVTGDQLNMLNITAIDNIKMQLVDELGDKDFWDNLLTN